MECTNYNSNLDVKDVNLGLEQIFGGRPRVQSIESDDSKKQTSLSNYDSDKDSPYRSYFTQANKHTLLSPIDTSKCAKLKALVSRCVNENVYKPLSHNLYITDSEEELNDDILEDIESMQEIGDNRKQMLSDDATIACYRKNCSKVMKVQLYNSMRFDKQGIASCALDVQNMMTSLREMRRRMNVPL